MISILYYIKLEGRVIDLYFVNPLLYLVHFGELVRYADKRIINIMKVLHRKDQLARRIKFTTNTIFITVKKLNLFKFSRCEATDSMKCQTPNANRDVLNHFGSISDSLGRLAAVSQGIASCMKIVRSICSAITTFQFVNTCVFFFFKIKYN